MLKPITAWVLACFFSVVFLTEGKLLGHAHVWINNAVIVHFDKNGMAGFKQEWIFDEMFSNMIIHDFDKNRNSKFEPAEVKEVYKGAFSNLKNFEYFTHVKINGEPFKVVFVKDFNAEIVKNKITYHFFVPCHIKAILLYKEIRIGIYDESFYTSINLSKDKILFQNDTGYEHHHRVELNKNEPYYYGQVYPEEIVLKFRKKNE
jgi:ABC-type uncharacterized transport system substrate-binding protein